MIPSSETWQHFLEQYAAYRAMPVWGTMVRIPDPKGKLDPADRRAIAERGSRAVERVKKIMKKFADRGGALWPTSPRALIENPDLLDRLRTTTRPGQTNFRNFWDALVFDRDGYACRYCGRDAFHFFQQTGQSRTLWLVVDHLQAENKLPGRFELSNSTTACWTCNTIKGPMPEPAFLQELDQLVDARLKRRAQVNAISLIYGEKVIDDLEFCSQHNDVIDRYSHGILTLQGAHRELLEAIARDPATIPGWSHMLKEHPEDTQVLQDFFSRLIAHMGK
jgi:5-methylcytosine-specific restriction endonuclease McrA